MAGKCAYEGRMGSTRLGAGSVINSFSLFIRTTRFT